MGVPCTPHLVPISLPPPPSLRVFHLFRCTFSPVWSCCHVGCRIGCWGRRGATVVASQPSRLFRFACWPCSSTPWVVVEVGRSQGEWGTVGERWGSWW